MSSLNPRIEIVSIPPVIFTQHCESKINRLGKYQRIRRSSRMYAALHLNANVTPALPAGVNYERTKANAVGAHIIFAAIAASWAAAPM